MLLSPTMEKPPTDKADSLFSFVLGFFVTLTSLQRQIRFTHKGISEVRNTQTGPKVRNNKTNTLSSKLAVLVPSVLAFCFYKFSVMISWLQ